MKTFLNPIAAAVAALFTITAPIAADARGPSGSGWHNGGGFHGGGHGGSWGHRGGYWRGGYAPFWGALGLGLGIGAIGYYGAYGGYGGYGNYYGYPPYVVSDDPGYITIDPPVSSSVIPSQGQPVPAASRAPDPIFYPRSGQSAAKTDTDRQECNRWATTQNGAMADASIFQRATFACMEGRGYTVR
ncbi:MAG: hypothetical protein ABI330_11795 [Caldimonas sp.]|nr:hypothetical protein [Pseudomonadota bacterium]